MQTSEAAGLAVALAKQEKTTPAQLNPEVLLRTLVERRQFVSFFNDVKVDAPEPSMPAAQEFGTKGFFHDYIARLAEPLKLATGTLWAGSLVKLRAGQFDSNACARAVGEAELSEATITEAEFSALLSPGSKPNPDTASAAITRGATLRMLWTSLNQR